MKKQLSILISFLLVFGPVAPSFAIPHEGKILSGKGTISKAGSTETIRQTSGDLSIGWGSFNIGYGQTVRFIQPSSSSIALNFISGTSASQIFGNLTANGQIYLMDPYGILFGKSADVNVGGLVAAGMNLQKYAFGTQAVFTGRGDVTNEGQIVAGPGGTVALVGQNVSNAGTITAPSGSIALGAGNRVTLDFSGNDLVDLIVNRNTAQSAIDNSGVLKANGGEILLKAGAQNSLVSSIVNNTGMIEAETMDQQNGKIVLLSGMENGTTNVGGTLDASAPSGGNGGTIETSGNRVNVASGTVVTTQSTDGLTGTWTLDPASFYIGMNTGTANDQSGNVLNYEDISGATLSAILNSSNVSIFSTQGAKGTQGNIYLNDTLTWNSGNSLYLNAVQSIEINKPLLNSGNGNIVLRADDLLIGGKADNTTGGGVPSGIGVVSINSGGSVSTTGNLMILTNPVNYGVALKNPGTAGGSYSNGNSSGTLTAYDLLSTNADLYWIDQNQNPVTVANNYSLQQNITLPSFGATGADGVQIASASSANGISSPTSSDYSNWIRFGGYGAASFSGIFSGQGNTISNLRIYDTIHHNSGFFGMISSTAQVLAVGFLNPSVTNSLFGSFTEFFNNGQNISSTEGSAVGTNNGGLIDLVYSSGGAVSATNNDHASGGLVGFNRQGFVLNSYSTTIFTSPTTSMSSNGGFIADNNGYLGNVYFLSTNSTLPFDTFTGPSGTYTSVYSTGPAVSGVTILTPSQFASASNLPGFNFNSMSNGTWVQNIGNSPWVEGTTQPILVPDTANFFLESNPENLPYSGNPYSGGNGVFENTSGNDSNVTLSGYSGSSQGAISPGTYSIVPDYSISQPTNQNEVGFAYSSPGILTITAPSPVPSPAPTPAPTPAPQGTSTTPSSSSGPGTSATTISNPTLSEILFDTAPIQTINANINLGSNPGTNPFPTTVQRVGVPSVFVSAETGNVSDLKGFSGLQLVK